MILVEDKVVTQSTALGTLQYTYQGYNRRQLVKLLIKPATASTTYDFEIIDKNNLSVYGRTGVTGEFIDDKLEENIYGNFTLAITNASANESFTILAVFKEIVY